MSIGAISSSQVTTGSGSTSSIQQLERQEQSVEKQIQSVEKDKTLDAKTKTAELEQLEAQLAQIEAEIAQKAVQQKANSAPKPNAEVKSPRSSDAKTGVLVDIEA